MQKVFEIEYPDGPYKDTYDLKNTITATYSGKRYLVIEITNSEIRAIKAQSDILDEISMEEYQDEGDKSFVLIDADEHTWEAAYITGEYTHEKLENYTETLPDGQTYEYQHNDGIFSNYFVTDDLQYNIEEKKFYRPRERLHMVSREDFFNGLKEHIKKIDTWLQNNRNVASEDKQRLKDFRSWLEKAPNVFDKIDHWKISFPDDLPKYY